MSATAIEGSLFREADKTGKICLMISHRVEHYRYNGSRRPAKTKTSLLWT